MSSRDIRNLRSGRQALRRDPRSFRLAPHAPVGAPLENLDPSRIAIRRAVQKAVHFDVQSCLTSAEGLAQTDSSRQEEIGEALTFDLTDDAVFFSPVSRVNYTAADLFPLFLREYVVHGQTVPAGVRQDGEGNLLPAGYDATLPVAAAELSPVPLPATGLLLMGGLGFLGAIRKRRRAAV
jgi:hypothetical protein